MRNPNLISLLFASLLFSSLSFLTISNANEDKDDDEHKHIFNYVEGGEKGPKQWGQVSSSWTLCRTGNLQSPININKQSVQVFPDLGKVERDYQPAPATIVNRGHDVVIQWQGEAGEITINDTEYKLVQCHWHTPSEHALNGKRYDMEMHLVHSSSKGERAVISLIYRFGRPDPFLGEVINKIKTLGHDRMETLGREPLELGIFSPQKIKFGDQKYYRYMGSLTSPPCTEGIIWTIANRLRTVSKDQVNQLRGALLDGFKDNARPLQDLNGRQVLLYA